MEGGIENSDIAYSRKDRFTSFNSGIVRGIVKGGECKAILDNVLHMLVNDDRLCHLLTAMDYPVPDGLNFFQALEDSNLLVDKFFTDQFQGVDMVLYVCTYFNPDPG